MVIQVAGVSSPQQRLIRALVSSTLRD